MAVSLRRKGASREATLAFLITTPETGVDSLAMTFAYCGPVLALARPVVAVATGLVAATLSLRQASSDRATPEPSPARDGGHDIACATLPDHADHGVVDAHMPIADRLRARMQRAVQYAFFDLFDELGFWLALAILLTGLLAALLPPDFFVRVFPSSFAAMLVVVLLGAPLYICASASTPLAALLIAKGATAGTALVFLLVGPATNATTLVTISGILGGDAIRLYLGSTIGVALAAGFLLDLVAPGLAQSIRVAPSSAADPAGLVKFAAAFVFTMLLISSLQRTGLRPGVRQLVDNAIAAQRWLRDVRMGSLFRSRAVQALVALWVLSLIAGAFWRVPIGAQAIVQRLGRVVGRPREPGLAFATPLLDRIELVAVDEVRERAIGYRIRPGSLERDPVPDEPLHLTADENVIDLRAETQYRVRDAVRYRLGVEAPDDVLAALVRARLVEAMAARSIDRVYTNARTEVERWLLRRLRHDAARAGLGVDVLAVRLLDVHAPATVHDAFRDVASAHEDRLTTIHLANQYAVSEIAVARGNAARLIAEAEGFAAQRGARAAGEANAFAALAAQHRRSPLATEVRLYIEAAERVLPGARKIISPAGVAASTELWLRGGASAEAFPPLPSDAAPETSDRPAKEWSPWPKEGAR
jgi:HflK protein